MVKIKKHRLPLELNPDYLLVAIASHEKGYHLSWILNQALGSHFARTSDYQSLYKKTDTVQSFPLFLWEDETRMLSYHLVSNRSENGFLFDDLRNIDFFLHVCPDPGKDFTVQLIRKLKEIPIIYACFPVDQELCPSKNLLFD